MAVEHRCENPQCQGETIPGVQLGVVGPDRKLVRNTVLPTRLLGRGHGFVVNGRRVCGACAQTKPKRKKGRRR